MRIFILTALSMLLLLSLIACEGGSRGHHEEGQTVSREDLVLKKVADAKNSLNAYLTAMLEQNKVLMDSNSTKASHTYNNTQHVYLKKFEGQYEKKPEALQYYVASSKINAEDTVYLFLRVSLESETKEDSFAIVSQDAKWKVHLNSQNRRLLDFMAFYGQYNELYKGLLDVDKNDIKVDKEQIKARMQEIKIKPEDLNAIKKKKEED
ncbi:MAG: hypothetical protein JJT94_14730 [Bernardetiaceae bacterium]|nr:hypothetical protein [Bernardetiaceae bacterium]